MAANVRFFFFLPVHEVVAFCLAHPLSLASLSREHAVGLHCAIPLARDLRCIERKWLQISHSDYYATTIEETSVKFMNINLNSFNLLLIFWC